MRRGESGYRDSGIGYRRENEAVKHPWELRFTIGACGFDQAGGEGSLDGGGDLVCNPQ